MAIEKLEQIKNPTDQELVELLQNMIRIPSWVPDDPSEEDLKWTQNENQLVDFIEYWIRKNTDLEVERQSLNYGRSNLIAVKGKPEIVILGHTDTVQPSADAPYDQLAAEIHDGKIWGRGSTDMKSGIASVLQAIKLSPDANNLMVAFYADEEYDFLGMKALVKKYGDLRPQLIISADGSDLEFGYGCRGLIEFRARVYGETGHPGVGTGKNAIWGSFEGLQNLKNYLSSFEHPVMGKTSFNLAYQLGGAKLPDSLINGQLLKAGQAGNVVPDVSEFVVDIRPASPDLTLNKIKSILADYFHDQGLGFEMVQERHNFGAWFTDIQNLNQFIELAKQATGQKQIQLDDPARGGYLDLQMLWNAMGKPDAFMFGGGVGITAHSPQEHIEISNLIKERDFFLKLLKSR